MFKNILSNEFVILYSVRMEQNQWRNIRFICGLERSQQLPMKHTHQSD